MWLDRHGSADQLEPDDVRAARDSLRAWIEENGPAGTDPYDALNSPLAGIASIVGRWGRIGFLQVVRRLPGALRWLAFIPRSINAKGVGLLARAYLEIAASRDDRGAEKRALEHLDWLEKNKVRFANGIGWGYPFDWAARAFFVPRHTPSIVVSSTVAHAFLDAYDRLGEDSYLETARGAARFVLSGLNRTELEAGICFSYTPLDRSIVLNASLMGAALLARVAAVSGDEALLEPARSATDFVLAEQKPDGSWCYGRAPFHRWIDGHHTGFILRDLALIRRATGWEHIDAPLRKGLGFYADRLVEADGMPLFRVGSPWPVDIHACAEAILVFTDPGLAPLLEDSLDRALGVAAWTLAHLRRVDGAFGYLRHPRRTDWTPHLRWGQAWMFLALARLERALAGRIPA